MIIEIIMAIVGIYLLCGALFAIPFLVKGLAVIDESSRGSKLGFRIIILPGTIVFWPLLLTKWVKVKKRK
jgi:hypothetical protein